MVSRIACLLESQCPSCDWSSGNKLLKINLDMNSCNRCIFSFFCLLFLFFVCVWFIRFLTFFSQQTCVIRKSQTWFLMSSPHPFRGNGLPSSTVATLFASFHFLFFHILAKRTSLSLPLLVCYIIFKISLSWCQNPNQQHLYNLSSVDFISGKAKMFLRF